MAGHHSDRRTSFRDNALISSFKKNIFFNYIGQLYTTLIGILILPMYLQYMGPEAYGLVGFYVLVQAWMNLLDMGMTPTLGREVARLKEHPSEHWRLVTVVNTLESLFLVLAASLGLTLFLSRDWVASDWLKVESLSLETVSTAVGVIAVTVAVRWVSSINRSGINAYEAQVWMNVIDIIVNTLRFPGSLLLVIWTNGSVMAFFYFQLVIVLIEIVVIRLKLRTLMPHGISGVKRFSTKELKRVAPFALSIGYTGAVWVLLTQLDKLILSKVLTLADYGYFTLVATIASGVTMLAGPVSKAVLPRMTVLLAVEKKEEMIAIYRRSTRMVVLFVAPVTLVIALMPELVVYTWTGDREAASWTAPILPLFVLGSGLLVIIAFQYYLQYAFGILKYHVLYNTASVVVNIPLIVFAAFNYGPVGVAWVWFGFRAFSFLLWVPYVHRKFYPGLHKQWMLIDVLPGFLVSIVVINILDNLFDIHSEITQLGGAVVLSSITLVSIFVTFLLTMQSKLGRS
ncbi:oligosaccharide flippase family protein [Marinobacter sp. 71-i]|uniref:Oligosaccharide flippase family protein n=1 Tax=Marinobacter iranensis TaxID=2962607 RepID=A0ABT5Y5L0_9GAMM|nr:oligosaccharide flippase family protein [Marinobacter iranensis]MDF0748955.1 oligosaccharide flippase family protein [Marinobacter iranensis]